MSSFPLRRLDDLCEVAAGDPAPQEQTAFADEGMPFVRMQDVGRAHHAIALRETVDTISSTSQAGRRLRRFPAGSLLIPKSGASINLNHRALLGVEAHVVSHLAVIVPRRDVISPEYLFYWSLSYDPRQQAQTTSLPSLPLSLIRAAQLPVPPLDEQCRIVDLLSRAASLKRLAEEAQVKARQLIPALFLDMFGDPATNPKGWPITKLRHLGSLDRGRSRHRPRNDPSLYGGDHPFIQTGDVSAAFGVIREAKQFYSDAGLAQSRLWPVGTLCITIAANIAETGVLAFPACFPDSVVGFTPITGVNTRYVQHFLDQLRPYLERTAPQLAQRNINLEILRELDVPAPPAALQEEFGARVEQIEAVEQLADRGRLLAEQTGSALMSRLFNA